ncbi:MAG: hypothetical protein J2O49_04825 [Sciscionella sp.]|nr:hypothetical protein [Sciscionella sp.]
MTPRIARGRAIRPRRRRIASALLYSVSLLVIAACGTPNDGQKSLPDNNKRLITDYFTKLDDAGTRGADAQRTFFHDTQDPDFPSRCDLGGLTVREQPTMSTLRLDPSWTPQGAAAGKHPKGTVYVVAAELTAKRDGSIVGNQIGSLRVEIIGKTVYGFAPCVANQG